ncbi:MAG: DUF432 domain-containing protein [Balneolaceae bacterium]|nr:DUF432 domain-containing protein [Balneolaceae bacterium]
MSNSFWGELPLEEDRKVRHLSIGNLHIWYQRRKDEIWIDHRYEGDAALPENGEPPDDLEWSRWAVSAPSRTLHLSPAFPDLPVVVASEYPLKITPGTTIEIYTRIPVWVRITLGAGGHQLIELPTIRLSKTWFGTPLEGELCYWSTTLARRSLEEVRFKPHVANCPIRISNGAEEDLDFDKICFRVERLKIFDMDGQLWSDEARISYQGAELNSDIVVSGRLPEDMPKGVLLAEPRRPVQRSLATRTFRKIIDHNTYFGR